MRQFRVVINGNEYKVAIEELEEDNVGATLAAAQQKPVQTAAPAAAAPRNSTPAKPQPGVGAAGNIVAALPGTILSIHVNIGDVVKRGQSLLILEAMKMENDIMAPADGVVKEIAAVKGASVNSGDLLMVLA